MRDSKLSESMGQDTFVLYEAKVPRAIGRR